MYPSTGVESYALVIFSNCLLSQMKLSEFLTLWQKDCSPHLEQSVLNILGLMKVMAVYKRGVTVTHPKPLIDVVVQMVQDKTLSDPVLEEVIGIAAALQRCAAVRISQEYACQLAYNVSDIKCAHFSFYFTSSLVLIFL